MDLKNKVAIVTGGSNGIGEAIVKKLESLGAEVIVFDIKKPKSALKYYKVNITSDAEIKEAVGQIDKVDILVNNAGVYFEKYIEDTLDEDIDKMVDINIKGTFKVTRNLIGKLKESKGCIVNIASCLGLVPELTSPLYCTTKAGIIMFTKCLAQEYANLGVRVNCVLPGPTMTELLEKSFKDEEQKNRCANRIPIKRIGTPEEVANVVAFLSSSEASYVTGGIYAVDGGVSTSSIYSK
ncbi:MAG: SDR family NAD(P)-dependent oxidoreductase [Bacilli bacterium]|nr:SDR family NAD(P)-dependent oxidoreductase [Bacilli bacterium]